MQAANFTDSIDQRVELFLTCRKLETMSKGDPIVRCYTEKSGSYNLNGETEVAKSNANPNFAKSLILEYFFEQKQRLRFEILDCYAPDKFELVGEVFTSLNELVGAKNQTSIFDIINRKQERVGKLIVQCEQVQECNDHLILQFSAEDLPKSTSLLPSFLPAFKVGFFGYTSAFLRFYRSREDSTWVLVYQTFTIHKNLSPNWQEFTISVQKLANGDYYRPIKLECVADAGGEYIVIGEVIFSVNDLIADKKREFKLKSDKYSPGTIKVKKCEIVNRWTFLDYVRGGVQLAVACAIDFTGSNGVPSSPDSLHAIRVDGSLNEYQRAIAGVCDILLAYDYDKLVPVYGFGGKPKFSTFYASQVSHCFACNGNPNNPDVFALQGIMDCYKHALKNVELAGPTLFAPLISETMKIAVENKQKGSQIYTILLILTDGEIHDMENTINCLIQSAKLPMSIIIVGIGGGNFGKMEILDGDDGLFNSNGVKAERDLVQFVPFRKFEGNQETLAKEVLEEIPRQLVEYMTAIGKKPDPPIKIDANVIYQQGPDTDGPVDYRKFGIAINDASYQQQGIAQNMMGVGYGVLGSQPQNMGINVPNQPNFNQWPPQQQQQIPNVSNPYNPTAEITMTNSITLNSFTNLNKK